MQKLNLTEEISTFDEVNLEKSVSVSIQAVNTGCYFYFVPFHVFRPLPPGVAIPNPPPSREELKPAYSRLRFFLSPVLE